MSLVTYDPDRLRLLRRHLAALAETPVAPAGDPAALEAVRRGRAVREVARRALVRVDAVLAADPLGASPGSVVLAADPSLGGLVDVQHATRLGAAVASLPRAAVTPALLAALGAEADRFAARPGAALAFAAALGPEGLVRLGHPVAASLQQGDDRTRDAFASVARVMGIAAAARPGFASALTTSLQGADPYVAALVLADGRLPGSVARVVLPRLLHDAAARPPVVAPRGPTVASLLADALVALPALTRALLPTLAPGELLAVLEGPWGSAAPPGGALLAAATDPSGGPLAEVVEFTDWLVRQLHQMPALVDGPLGMHLGGALAPWLLDLAPLDRAAFPHLPPARLASAPVGAEVLERVTGRPGSAAVMVTASDDVLREHLQDAAADPAYERRIQPYAVLSAQVDAWAVEGARQAADEEYDRWSTTVSLVGWAAGKAAHAIPEVGALVAPLAPAVVREVMAAAGHPPDPVSNARLADVARWSRQAAARDAATAALFVGAVAAGSLPPRTPPPPLTGTTVLDECRTGCDPAVAGATDQERAARALEDWVEAAPTASERAGRQEVRARVDAFTRAYDGRVEAER